MATTQKTTTAKPRVSRAVKKTAVDSVEKLEKIAVTAKTQAIEVIEESKEALDSEVKQLNADVQKELNSFKQELFKRLETIKLQFSGTQQDISELKSFIKSELNTVVNELSKLTVELKADVSQISLKHKDHLVETIKRSKDHTLQVWHKVSTKQ